MESVMFSDENLSTFNFILKSKKIPLPDPKTSSISIPGRDGEIDTSTILTDGNIKYKNRKIEIQVVFLGTYLERQKGIDKLANYIHGKKHKVIFSNDNSWYWVGRCDIASVDSKEDLEVKIELNAEPYKNCITDSSEPWVYDGVTYPSLKEIFLTGSRTIEIYNTRRWTVPEIIVDKETQVTIGNNQYSLAAGTHTLLALLLKEGTTTIVAAADNGKISILFRRGSL